MAHGGGDFKKYPFYKKWLMAWTPSGSAHFANWLNGWAFDPLVVSPIIFLVLLIVAHHVDPDAVLAVFAIVVGLSPIGLPIGLMFVFWTNWVHYIWFAFWFTQEYALLEVTVPPETTKTPQAMELFLVALWNSGGETTFIQRIWRGQFRIVTSLEIASNEGRINFYMHVRRGWKDIIAARLYGQYPEAQVREVPDYVTSIPFNLNDYDLFGSEYKKSNPQGFPIKTYVDYGLHMNADDQETQVDPITNLLELFGSIGKGEYFWMQLLVKARKRDNWYGFEIKPWGGGYVDKYAEEVKESIRVTMKEAADRTLKAAGAADPASPLSTQVAARGVALLSQPEKDRIESAERNLNKLIFECGVRVIYLAKKENYVGVNAGAIIRFFDAYRANEYNSLGVTRGTSYFDYPWQDWNNYRRTKEKRNLYFNYRHRAYFYVPYDQAPVYMTSEELATIWHFPSSVVKTPGLARVPAKVSEAPANIPTGI